MRLRANHSFHWLRNMNRLTVLMGVGTVSLLLLASPLKTAQAQEQDQAPGQGEKDRTPPTTSELAVQNLSHVAASAQEIRAILQRDSGLMVELKRWIAKDATDHGQIVSDPDLSNEAIFERLESDVRLRAIATALVQQYGYLLPQVNPNSDLGKQQALLMQERTKWLAQDQEQQLAEARQLEMQKMKAAANANCDQAAETDCNSSPSRPSPADIQRQLPRSNQVPLYNPPAGSFPSNQPNIDQNPLLRAQLMQTGQDSTGLAAQYSLLGSSDPFQQFNGLNINASGSSPVGLLQGSLSDDSSPRRVPFQSAGAGDGLLGAFGLGNAATSGILPDLSGMNGLSGGSTQPTFPSPVVPWGASNGSYNTGRFEAPRVEPAEVVRKTGPYGDIPSLYDMYVQAVAAPIRSADDLAARFSRTGRATLN